MVNLVRAGSWRWSSTPAIGCALLLMSSAGYLRNARAESGAPRDDWQTVGGDLANTRFSGLDRITSANVGTLGGAWFAKLNSATRSPPVVIHGVMYMADATSVYAMDAASGKVIWEYKSVGAGLGRGVAVGGGLVFCGSMDAHIVALDPKNGRAVWKAYIGAVPEHDAAADKPKFNASANQMAAAGATGADLKAGWPTSAPVYANGVVMSGLSGGDVGVPGSVTGLDAKTGKRIWRFEVIPSAGAQGSESWPSDGWGLQQGGGAVWSPGAADPDLGLVYYGTGNPVPQTGGELRAGNNLYTVSIIALDIRSGELKWHYQLVHHDLWEMDESTPIVLYDAQAGGKPQKMLAAMRADGYLFLLDRKTGTPVFPVEERPVKQDIRQRTSPTQPFPVNADEFGPRCAPEDSVPTGFKSGCYFDPPYFDQPDVMVPVTTTRNAPMSYDPRTGYIYVTGVVSPWWYRRLENPAVMVVIHPPSTKEHGIFAAIDTHTNKIVWQERSRWGLAGGSGALATAGGVLFHMEGDGNLQANDSKTGEMLWRFQTGLLGVPGTVTLGGGGVPLATYAIDGEQYVVAPVADGVWAFKLGGTLQPQPAPPVPPEAYGFEGAVRALGSDGTAEIHIAGIMSRAEHAFDEYEFDPLRARVRVGTTLKFTNYGVKPHTIVSADGSWTTGQILPMQSASVEMGKKGVFVYFSKEFPWARGQLFVQ